MRWPLSTASGRPSADGSVIGSVIRPARGSGTASRPGTGTHPPGPSASTVTVVSTPVFDAEPRRLVDLVAKHRLPAVYTFKAYVDAGGLMSYGPDISDLFRRAATYVDKILKGARPGDLPVEQPTKFELLINLKTAKALGLTIPPSLLARADQVVE